MIVNIISMERLFRGHRINVTYYPGNNDYKVQGYKVPEEELVFEYIDTSSEGPYDIMNKAKIKVGTLIKENNDRT
jgi:hypothetical protein